MKNYVISLASAVDRREHITTEFGKQNIEFTFFDAITPDMILQLDKKFGFDLSNAVKLSKGEKACFASHVCLWQKMIDENLDFLAIFEDDVFLGQDASQVLNDNAWVNDIYKNEPFDMIKLETFLIKVHLGKQKQSLLKSREIYRLKSMHTGTGGYILTLNGARNLLTLCQKIPIKRLMAVDHLIFDGYLNSIKVLQLFPAVCIQGMLLDSSSLKSNIESNRELIRKKQLEPKKNIVEKIQSFAKRLLRSVGKRTFFKIVEFK